MKATKKSLAIILVLAMMIATLGACGNSEPAESEGEVGTTPEYTWTASCSNTEEHPAVQGMYKFAELMEEKSGGRIHMDVFHSAQLSSDRDSIEGMQMNTIQSSIMVTAPLAGFTGVFLPFDLPFLLDGNEEARAVCDSEVGQDMLVALEEIGMKGLGFMEYGMRNTTNSKRPIETPADLVGIKIRTMENSVHMDAFRAMGADPTPMAFGELFTALQQKTIDAQENPLSVITSSKFNECQTYLSMTEHLYSAAPLLVSKTAYDELPADLQAVVDEAGKEACEWQREYSSEMEEQMLNDLIAAGMEVNYPDKAPFIEAIASVYEKYVGDGADQVSPAILEEIYSIIGR